MLRKITNIRVPSGAGSRKIDTKSVFATYDKQSAAFAFYFSDSNIARATANLLFMVDGQKVFVDDGVTLSETNETHTFTYSLPDKLLNYTGKVDGYLYFDFEDDSHSDEIHFVFTIKKSQIDEEMEDAPDVYIKSFEDVKEHVEQAGDSATKDIEKAKDNAESQIGDYVGEVESAKQDIDSSVSDVQSKASEASEDIEESAKEVKKAKTDTIKSMRESDISDKNYLLDSKKRVLEERSAGIPSDNANYGTYYLSDPVPAGTEFTVSGKLEITDGDFDAISIYFRDENSDGIGYSHRVEYINNEFSSSFTLSKTLYKIYIYAGIAGSTRGNGVIYTDVKLQTGPLATPWTPNPQQIVTQNQYDKLANAIINLGGSL